MKVNSENYDYCNYWSVWSKFQVRLSVKFSNFGFSISINQIFLIFPKWGSSEFDPRIIRIIKLKIVFRPNCVIWIIFFSIKTYRLLICIIVGLGALYLLHKLAQDYMKIKKPASKLAGLLLSKRDLNAVILTSTSTTAATVLKIIISLCLFEILVCWNQVKFKITICELHYLQIIDQSTSDHPSEKIVILVQNWIAITRHQNKWKILRFMSLTISFDLRLTHSTIKTRYNIDYAVSFRFVSCLRATFVYNYFNFPIYLGGKRVDSSDCCFIWYHTIFFYWEVDWMCGCAVLFVSSNVIFNLHIFIYNSNLNLDIAFNSVISVQGNFTSHKSPRPRDWYWYRISVQQTESFNIRLQQLFFKLIIR